MLSLNFLKRVSGDGSVRSARFCHFCGALGVGRGLRRRVDLHAHRHPRAHHSRGMHTQPALMRKRAGLKLLSLSLSLLRARARLHCKKLYSRLNHIYSVSLPLHVPTHPLIKAAAAGKHCAVEKPVAESIEATEQAYEVFGTYNFCSFIFFLVTSNCVLLFVPPLIYFSSAPICFHTYSCCRLARALTLI